MDYVPAEIICQQISYITNVNDIIRLRQINPQFKHLSTYCTREITGINIPANLVLSLNSLMYVNGIVRVYDLDTVNNLGHHASIRKIRVQYVAHPKIERSEHHRVYTIALSVARPQFEVLCSLVRSRLHLSDFDVSIVFPNLSTYPNYNNAAWGGLMFPFRIMGVRNNIMYIKSRSHEDNFDSSKGAHNVFLLDCYHNETICVGLNLFNNMGIDTLITNSLVLQNNHKPGDFTTNLTTVHVILSRNTQYTYNYFSLINLINVGKLRYIKVTPIDMLEDDIQTYTKSLHMSLTQIHGHIEINHPVYLDIPIYSYMNTVDLFLSIFNNLSLVSVYYDGEPFIERTLNTIDKLLSRSDIHIINVYPHVSSHIEDIKLPSDYLNNPRIRILSHPESELTYNL